MALSWIVMKAMPRLWSVVLLAMLPSIVFAQPKRFLEQIDGEASCLRSIVRDAAGKAVVLPAYVSDHLDCGYVSLSPNTRWLTFVRDDQLLWWDFETRRTHSLTELPLKLDGLQTIWAADSKSLALVVIEQPSAVPAQTQVRVFRTGPQGIWGEQRFYLPLAFSCASTCFAFDIHWESPYKLRYQHHLGRFPEPGDPALYKTLSLSHTDPRYIFPLAEAFGVRVVFSPKATLTLNVLPSNHLEVFAPKLRQLFPLKTIGNGIPPELRASVRLDDFDFDGWLDLAIPQTISDTGENVTYELYAYSPTQNRFVELKQSGKPLLLDNVSLDTPQRLLMGWTKAGRYGSGKIFRFERGVPWLYRAAKAMGLDGYAPGGEVIYDLREFDREGKVLRNELSEFPSAFKPVLRTLRQEHIVYDEPERLNSIGVLKGGTQVKILELRVMAVPEEVQWRRVEVNGLKGWIKP